jgi:hypothetical protein
MNRENDKIVEELREVFLKLGWDKYNPEASWIAYKSVNHHFFEASLELQSTLNTIYTEFHI